MKRTRITALVGVSAMAAAAAIAMAPAANAAILDGCPSGDLCAQPLPDTNPVHQSVPMPYNPNDGYGVSSEPAAAVGEDAAYVNNTDPVWSSEGNFVLEVGGLVCIYVPDTGDTQAPDTVEDPADASTSTDAFSWGATQAEVDSITVTLLANC